MNRIAVLKNSIQEYSWGSRTFIPELMGEPAPAENPKAELWMGAHPKAPSQVLYDGGRISLSELIQEDPEGILGPSVAAKFSSTLPFLFKVLASARPLSIQAHPNREQAEEGFARENRMKIPLDDPRRNYRDENHKPELICALSPLTVLKGFRRIEDILMLMDRVKAPGREPAIELLRVEPNAEGLKRFFLNLMTMDKEIQSRVIGQILPMAERSAVSDTASDWLIRLNKEYPGDIGVLSPLFLNLIQLQPGEAMYIPAGELHAYLEGAGIELMANSDNVLRGGLTPKHMDGPELCKLLNFTAGDTDVLSPEKRDAVEAVYPSVAEEFMLSVISLHDEGSIHKSPEERSVEIMICTEGKARVTDPGNGDILELSGGSSIIIPAAVNQYLIQGRSTIYKASVPL
ncbi:MAG: mannose-6-phosphate isomerase, class I [Deltaproteobacteria bacterium]|nr:mannose-6-phosphate isomerase, class I [Deltaproteobacteria bacterium]